MQIRSWVAVLAVAFSSAALADDASGTRVTIKAANTVQLPQADKLADAVMAVGGGERQVMVQKKQAESDTTLQLDLWGAVTPASEIASTLREAFPVLKDATIDVTTLDASQRPQLPPDERPADGKKRIIKKVIKHEETQK